MRTVLTIVTSLTISLVPGVQTVASIELVEEQSFTVSPLGNPIERIEFNSVFGGLQAALVSDGEMLVLWLVEYSTPAFTYVIEVPDGAWLRDFDILLDDVNCDSRPDIILVTFTDNVFDPMAEESVSICEITVLDGASYFHDASKVLLTYPEDLGAYTLLGSATALGITTLESYDTDGNGAKNLLLSFDYGKCVNCIFPWYLVVESFGVFQSYNCFPSSLAWDGDLILSRVEQIDPDGAPWSLIAFQHAYLASDVHGSEPTCSHEVNTVIVAANGSYKENFDPPAHADVCSIGVPDSKGSGFGEFEIGDIIPSLTGNELVARAGWWESCRELVNGEFLETDTSGCELMAYEVSNGKPSNLLWRTDYAGCQPHGLKYIPEYPGYFFAFYSNSLVQLSGTDGFITETIEPIPEGSRLWASPYGDDRVRLVSISGNQVSVYRVDEATDAPITPDTDPVPEDFVLHQPYPNPFNLTLTIPLTIDRACNLRVEIYNLLGRKVANIHDGPVSAGQVVLSWDGENDLGQPVSSGLYLIRAATDSVKRSVKCLLLK
ncbi:MAG: T9SS type A sorting domain-containing protein [Candidatus Zixiibacteriota bacterium]|nr:MAG: T9SS type A sorting domain-containing protein [candidate division Zixibacteria bacterium]